MFKNCTLLMALLCALTCLQIPSYAQSDVVFQDQFDSMDFAKWTYVGPFDGNSNSTATQVTGGIHMAIAPFVTSENGVSFARLTLETFDNYTTQNQDGTIRRYFKGTEMYSRKGFGPNIGARSPNVSEKVDSPPIQSATGFEFEARMRYTNPQPSGVGAFWTYWNHGTWPNYRAFNAYTLTII